jgi:hypothetical protein
MLSLTDSRERLMRTSPPQQSCAPVRAFRRSRPRWRTELVGGRLVHRTPILHMRGLYGGTNPDMQLTLPLVKPSKSAM